MAQAYINQYTTDLLSLKSRLLPGSSRALSEKFDALNLHLRHGLVTPGQRVLIPQEYGVACTADDAWLMRHAQEIRRRLDQDASAGTVVIGHYDVLQSWLGYGSLGVGSTTSAWAQHVDEVKQTLSEIEQLHQRFKNGTLERRTFLQQRDLYVKRGEITEEELAAIPIVLKRWLIAYYCFSSLQITGAFTWYVWAKLL